MAALQTFQEELELYQAEATTTKALLQQVDQVEPAEIVEH